MNTQSTDYNQVPLLRASTLVINTPVKTTAASPCASFMPRYNVGNIHEIKQLWNVPQQG